MGSQPLLKALLRQRHWQTHRTFRAEYDKAAKQIDARFVGHGPSRAQLFRWTSGELKGLPHSDHCRVLEVMFEGYSADELFGTAPEDHTEPADGASGPDPRRQPTSSIQFGEEFLLTTPMTPNENPQ